MSVAPASQKKEPAPKKETPPAPKKEAAKETAPIKENADIAAQLQEAKKLFDNLEYDRVVPIATAILARADVNIDQRLDAYLLQGSSLAIIGDAVEAEKPFRFLLRGRPEFDMTPETSPKIL